LSQTRHRFGYFMVDHRASPGLDPEWCAKHGVLSAPKGQLLEANAAACGHCGKIMPLVHLELVDYCPKCNHDICPTCEADRVRTLICTPMAMKLDVLHDLTEHGRPLPVQGLGPRWDLGTRQPV
jgi:hypothetical protein